MIYKILKKIRFIFRPPQIKQIAAIITPAVQQNPATPREYMRKTFTDYDAAGLAIGDAIAQHGDKWSRESGGELRVEITTYYPPADV